VFNDEQEACPVYLLIYISRLWIGMTDFWAVTTSNRLQSHTVIKLPNLTQFWYNINCYSMVKILTHSIYNVIVICNLTVYTKTTNTIRHYLVHATCVRIID